jgi:MOSC domain-containing protein YiiM
MTGRKSMQGESTTPRVHSVNVSGELRSVLFAGHWVTTGFFKSPRSGMAYAHKLGIQGDAQGDLSVHGGPEKAVYFYAREHYAAWEVLLGSGPLPPGSFGENITSEGLLETDLNIGDILRIGTATLQVLQPRSPCYKLQIGFGRSDMTALFFHQAKPGWYASVLQEGTFSADDDIVLVDRAPEGITVADIWRYSAQPEPDGTTVDRVRSLNLLPDFWKNRISRDFCN